MKGKSRVETPLYHELMAKEKKHIHVMSPTFGRVYTTPEIALAAWNLGATFNHECGPWCVFQYKYANKQELTNHANGDGVLLRYGREGQTVKWEPDTSLWGPVKVK